MPVLKNKGITWTCKTCQHTITTESSGGIPHVRDDAFEHSRTHGIVTENERDWFNKHFKNYYDVT